MRSSTQGFSEQQFDSPKAGSNPPQLQVTFQ